MNDIAKTPREELECKKKYLYEYGMFWECNDGSKCQILEDDVCDLLNELNNEFEDCGKLLDSKDDFIHKFKKDIEELKISIKLFEDDIATKDKKIEEQQTTITELKSIINFASNEGDLIIILMKEIIKLRQEVQECQAYETIEKGVSNYD